MKPTITVGIPFYKKDDPQMLDASIASILNQSKKPDVIHLIQDGSCTKEIDEIIKKYDDPIFHHIIFEENKGLPNGLNYSIQQCDTKYYARMDADDIAVKNRLEKQVEFLEKNTDVDVLGGAIELIDDQGRKIGFRNYPTTINEARNYIHLGSPFAHPTIVFRKSVFKRNIFYNTNLRVSQDIELWFKMLSAGVNFANLDEVILRYRISNNFYNRRGYSKAKDELFIYLRGLHKEFGITTKYIFPLMRFFTRCSPTFFKRFIYKSVSGKILNHSN